MIITYNLSCLMWVIIKSFKNSGCLEALKKVSNQQSPFLRYSESERHTTTSSKSQSKVHCKSIDLSILQDILTNRGLKGYLVSWLDNKGCYTTPFHRPVKLAYATPFIHVNPETGFFPPFKRIVLLSLN